MVKVQPIVCYGNSNYLCRTFVKTSLLFIQTLVGQEKSEIYFRYLLCIKHNHIFNIFKIFRIADFIFKIVNQIQKMIHLFTLWFVNIVNKFKQLCILFQFLLIGYPTARKIYIALNLLLWYELSSSQTYHYLFLKSQRCLWIIEQLWESN